MHISELRLRSLNKKQITRLLDQIDNMKQRHKAEQHKLLVKFFPDITTEDLDSDIEKPDKPKPMPKAKKAKGSLDISMSSDSESESDEE